jgi:ribosomal protein S18 acetylase RimI-like enzyme
MIRDAVAADAGQLFELVEELATYERAAELVDASEADLHAALFGPDPKVFAIVAEEGGLAEGGLAWPEGAVPEGGGPEGAGPQGSVVGMAIYFFSFSTWTGRHGLYVEDIFVKPEHRSRGIGRALLRALAARAVELGCARVEWAVLNWNERAIDFYRSLGAVAMDEWTTYRLMGPALADLAVPSGEDA